MRFGILGTLLVADDSGAEIFVPAGRQRAVLAALMAHANRPVSFDALAELVWDAAPPTGAASTLRSYVKRLRGALGGEVAVRIETREPGYALRASEAELDFLRFEALCRRTDDAVRAADWAGASRDGAAAVDLWRGIPLADVPSQTLRDAWLPRLEQQRAQVTEWRIEAELHLGRHASLVPQLRRLADEFPLRERYHAQLMLALVRSGRRAEALAAYRQARRALVDELGVEPGPELRRLHERILTGDTDPSGPAAPARISGSPASAGPSAAPRRLPAGTGHFVGRADELKVLSDLVDRASVSGATVVISAIDGMAGIGKTALAVHAAHRLAERFPDGQLFLDLHGHTKDYPPRGPGEAVQALLRALDVPAGQIPEDTEERAALYRQRLAGTRTLILLDNALDEAQIRPLLPGGGTCLVMVTSRRRLKGLDDTRTVSLDVLPKADAIALLHAVAGPARIAADDPLLDEIAELCGHLPLALRIAGALLRHRPAWPLEHLAGQLRGRHQRIHALSDGERDLTTTFDLSYTSLDEQHRLTWRRLGVVPGADLDAYAAAALAQSDPATVSGLLENLVDHNLLISPAAGRYRPHDLLRDHARALAAADPDRVSALDRLLRYYAYTAQVASALIARYPRPAPEGPKPAHTPALADPESARAWLRAERDNVEAAYVHARALNLDEHVLALATGLAVVLSTDGPFTRALELYQTAAQTAERHGDLAAHATALTEVGILRRLTGDLAGAAVSLERARELTHAAGRRQSEATALTELGIVLRLSGDQAGAGEAFLRALDLYRATGHRQGEATALTDLGVVRQVIGDLAGASDALTEALEIYRAIGFRHGEADALAELGRVRQLTGYLAGALDDHARALEIYRAIGHRHGEATTLTRLGALRQQTGDRSGAGEALARAREIYRAVGQRSGEAYALSELGVVQLLSGNASAAADSQEQALDIFRANDHRANEAAVLNRYAGASAAGGDTARAQALYRRALAMNRELNKPDDEAIALEGLGACHLAIGEGEPGVAHLRQALEIYERLGMTPDAERVRPKLAEAVKAQDRR